MITIIRWWIYKAKVIKLKLGVVSLFEQLLKEVTKNGDDIQKKFIAEFAKLIHEDNKVDQKGVPKNPATLVVGGSERVMK